MSQKHATNLIQNGDFSEGKQGWALSEPSDLIKFEDGYCVMQVNAVIQQHIKIPRGKYFLFSIKMKTAPGSACIAEVSFNDGGPPKTLTAAGGEDWHTKSVGVETPSGSGEILVTVSLRVDDGRYGIFGAHFDDAMLVQQWK